MRYWWVNQNQTFRQEFEGGYLWSPKRKTNGGVNPYYEFMREVAPGDVIFSFADTYIQALGIAKSFCRESPKPVEFGAAGTNWSQVGWRVDVAWRKLRALIKPSDHMDQIRGFLPGKYAPLRSDGRGLQSVYLTEVPRDLAAVLFKIIGKEALDARDVAQSIWDEGLGGSSTEPDIEEWERRIEAQIIEDGRIPETERRALVLSRRGQGKFRASVRRFERECRVTKVDRLEHLIASHVKPWRDSSHEERLDGENGLLLTPTIDHLFDKGFISFENNGRLIVSNVASVDALARMGVDGTGSLNVGKFSEGQRKYLDFHRENVLRVAKVKMRNFRFK